jgi:hypothetical protein
VRSSKKFNGHVKVPFVLARFQTSATPRPENSDSEEKAALFGLDTQITTWWSSDLCFRLEEILLACKLINKKQ